MELVSHFRDFLVIFATPSTLCAAIGALLYVASTSMKTVIPLRIAAIGSSCAFLLSGIFARSVAPILLYCLLLPLNVFRLYQMLELIKKVRAAASSDLSMDWLQPFMRRRKFRKGEILFRKGDLADEMFLAEKGKFVVSELGIELKPGQIFGEMGLLTSGSHRTATVECVESGQALMINYDQVRELYFENPEFGFYFLRLVGERLLHDLRHLEEKLAQERQLRMEGAS
jgi:hypothetical protein